MHLPTFINYVYNKIVKSYVTDTDIVLWGNVLEDANVLLNQCHRSCRHVDVKTGTSDTRS